MLFNMKKILPIILFAILFPLSVQAAIATPWNATSTEKGYISPNRINGNDPFLKALYYVATSTIASLFPYASTTAISVSGLVSGNCVQAGTGGLLTTTGTPCGSGSGGVTSVTGTYPVISSGGTTPAISLAFGTTTSNLWAGIQTFTNSPIFSILGAGAVNSRSDGTIYSTATSTPTVTAPIAYSGTLGSFIGGISGAFTCAVATGSVAGCLSAADWTTFNGKQGAITLTTTGTSGAATFIANTLNIPQYAGGVTSVSNSDSTLTISPTTGAVVAGINLANPNTWTAAQTIQSNSATAFAVGANGATNPALLIDASTASSATGISIKSNAAGLAIALKAISSSANEALNISSKGTGNMILQAGAAGSGSVQIQGGGTVTEATFGQTSIALSSSGNSSTGFFSVTSNAQTSITAGVEKVLGYFNFGQLMQSVSGTGVALTRDFRITPSSRGFSAFNNGTNIITNAAGFALDGAPQAGLNGLITNSSAILVQSGTSLTASTTNGYGLNVNAPNGALNNYAAMFNGGNVGIGTTSPYAALALGGGNLVLGAATAGGTPGDLFLPKLGTAAGSFIAVDATGKVIATTTPAGSANYWTSLGNAIYNNTGKSVAINLTNPTADLEVQATSSAPDFIAWDTTGTSNLFNIQSSGNVGVGTTTPWAQLSINPNGITTPAFVIGSSTMTNFIVANPGTNAHVGINSATPVSTLDVVSTEENNIRGFSMLQYGNTGAFSSVFNLFRSGGTPSAPLAVSSGYSLGRLVFRADDGTNHWSSTLNSQAAQFSVAAAENWSSTNHGANFMIQTVPIGSTALSTRFLIDGNGNTAIGSTTPYGALTVSTLAQQAATSTLFAVASTTNATLFNVLASGNVGVGTSSPSKLFTVEGNQSGGIMRVQRDFPSTPANSQVGTYDIELNETPAAALAEQSGPAQTFGVASAGGAENIYTDISGVRDGADTSGSLVLRTYNAGTPATGLYINHLQQVGIGTTSPAFLLDLNSGTAPQLALADNVITDPQWTFRNAGGTLYIGTSSPATYATSSPSAISIVSQSTTQLGVGTTSPWRTLSITGTAAIDGLTVSSTGDALCLSSKKEIEDAGSASCIVSSQKAKHDIQTITDTEASEVLDLHAVSYVLNGSGEQRYGFIAEEVAKIDPKLVEYAHEDTTVMGINGDPVVIHTGEPLTVDYTRYIGLLTAQVQRQEKQIQKGVFKSAQDNWQDILIGILFIWCLYLTFRKK